LLFFKIVKKFNKEFKLKKEEKVEYSKKNTSDLQSLKRKDNKITKRKKNKSKRKTHNKLNCIIVNFSAKIKELLLELKINK
jgi:DNA-binding sugar fermentation-stimulating protein